MENCIFCKIATREIPAEIVYEDDTAVAFLDNKPVLKGHTLVIPKEHVRNMLDASPDIFTPVYSLAQSVARAQREALGATGVNITNNNEPAAGQEVFHFHVHVIPRFEGDELTHWPKIEYKEGEMGNIGTKLSKSLGYEA